MNLYSLLYAALLCVVARAQLPFIEKISHEQLIAENDTLALDCKASGQQPLQVTLNVYKKSKRFSQYQWYLNDDPVSTPSQNGRYTKPDIRRTEAGLYRCLVRNAQGALYSDFIRVRVAYLDEFDRNPANTRYRFNISLVKNYASLFLDFKCRRTLT